MFQRGGSAGNENTSHLSHQKLPRVEHALFKYKVWTSHSLNILELRRKLSIVKEKIIKPLKVEINFAFRQIRVCNIYAFDIWKFCLLKRAEQVVVNKKNSQIWSKSERCKKMLPFYLILIITNIGNVLAIVHCAHTAIPDVLLHTIDITKTKI